MGTFIPAAAIYADFSAADIFGFFDGDFAGGRNAASGNIIVSLDLIIS
jgi:hypothetical protein